MAITSSLFILSAFDISLKLFQPVSYTHLDKDDATPLSDGVKMSELIKDSGLVTIEGAGHYAFLEDVYKRQGHIFSFLYKPKTR